MNRITAHVGTEASGKPKFELVTSKFKDKDQLLNCLKDMNGSNILRISNLEYIGLTPREQGELMRQIKDIVENNKCMFEFTTNSPFILNELGPEQVIVHYKGNMSLLSQHPDIEWDKASCLSTGEIWLTEGEEWVGKLCSRKSRLDIVQIQTYPHELNIPVSLVLGHSNLTVWCINGFGYVLIENIRDSIYSYHLIGQEGINSYSFDIKHVNEEQTRFLNMVNEWKVSFLYHSCKEEVLA